MTTLDDKARIYLQEWFKQGRASFAGSRETGEAAAYPRSRASPNTLARDSPLFIQAADGRIKSACYAHTCRTFVSIHFAKRKGDRLSIDSASLERWFFTGVSSQSTSAKPKGDRLSRDSASHERWFFNGVSSQSLPQTERGPSFDRLGVP
ncbi:hypothetical protein B0H14DRAFT_3142837 [Mycena olivaceomarginata]|nr:hypothetical protein B0H14DRAFT_3142837 [Mycena olivaceomarginata]